MQKCRDWNYRKQQLEVQKRVKKSTKFLCVHILKRSRKQMPIYICENVSKSQQPYSGQGYLTQQKMLLNIRIITDNGINNAIRCSDHELDKC